MTPIEEIRRYLRLIEDNVYGADVWIKAIREQLLKLEDDEPFFKTRVCGVAVCNWSGPVEEFDNHPHRSF